VGVPLKDGFDRVPIGKAETLRSGEDIALLAIGPIVQNALEAATILQERGISCEVVNMRFVKPLDASLLDDIASRFGDVITIEDNVVTGGFGSAVGEYLATGTHNVRLTIHGIPDEFIEHGSPAELSSDLGLDTSGIARLVESVVGAARSHKNRHVGVAVK
ncbi:MAG: 1-deoxy-D-xylulose-5-phosphate synthase, partial [Ignavibacteria bacterium]|nr:1-deoxy-D-xylulose-5-phosphate synthase [Ignavibacteria bacterium]